MQQTLSNISFDFSKRLPIGFDTRAYIDFVSIPTSFTRKRGEPLKMPRSRIQRAIGLPIGSFPTLDFVSSEVILAMLVDPSLAKRRGVRTIAGREVLVMYTTLLYRE